MQYTLLHKRTGQAINLEAAAPFMGPDFFGLASWEEVAAHYGRDVLPDFELVPMHEARRAHGLRRSIRKARAQRDELASLVLRATQDIAALRRELRDNEEQNERLGAERDLLAEVVKDFRKDGPPIRPATNLDGSVDLHATAERLTAQVDNQQKQIAEHIAGVDELGRGFAALREKLEQAEGDRGVLIAQKEMLERDLRQANRDVHATKQAAEMLKLDRSKLDNQCSALKTELELATREREAALKQLEKLEAKLESMGPIQEELEADLRQKSAELADLRVSHDSLAEQVATLRQHERQALHDRDEWLTRCGDRTAECEKLRQQVKQLTDTLSEQRQANGMLSRRLEETTGALADARRERDQLKADIEQLGGTLSGTLQNQRLTGSNQRPGNGPS